MTDAISIHWPSAPSVKMPETYAGHGPGLRTRRMLRFLRAGQAVGLSAGGFSWETPSTSEAKDAPTDYFIIDGSWDFTGVISQKRRESGDIAS
jgi:hypothetical protein